MEYIFVQTKPYQKSLHNFLYKQSPLFLTKRNQFKKTFSENPFAPAINTHDLFQKQQTIIYSSYITKKIRLIWLLVKPNTIIPYRIITDHDYHKIQQLYPAILILADVY